MLWALAAGGIMLNLLSLIGTIIDEEQASVLLIVSFLYWAISVIGFRRYIFNMKRSDADLVIIGSIPFLLIGLVTIIPILISIFKTKQANDNHNEIINSMQRYTISSCLLFSLPFVLLILFQEYALHSIDRMNANWVFFCSFIFAIIGLIKTFITRNCLREKLTEKPELRLYFLLNSMIIVFVIPLFIVTNIFTQYITSFM